MTESAPFSPPLAQDVLCIGCGYNLRGLDPSGRCPECGLSIADSNRGDRLAFADPAWLNKLRFGASLKLLNILIIILITIVGGVLVGFMGLPYPILIIISTIGALLGLWATYCITTQEPRTALTEDPVTLRKVIRASAVIVLFGSLAQQLGGMALTAGSTLRGANALWIVIALISGVAGLVVMIGELKYFRRFALRAPDLKLARSTRIVMWGLAITTGFTSVGSVVFAAILTPAMGRLAAGGTAAATTTMTAGIGYTTTVTTAGATAAQTTGATAPPAMPMPGIATAFFGVGACIFVAATAVFFLWYVSLLSRYRKLFQHAMEHSLRTAQSP